MLKLNSSSFIITRQKKMSRNSSISSQGGATPSSRSSVDFDLAVRQARSESSVSMDDRIRAVQADLYDIKTFYSLSVSPELQSRLAAYYHEASKSLSTVDFDALDQQERVDYLLLRNYLRQQAAQLDAAVQLQKNMAPVLPFFDVVVDLCSMRDHVTPFHAEAVADKFAAITDAIAKVTDDIGAIKVSKTTAYRAAQVVKEARESLAGVYDFYAPYDAQFAWWVATPWEKAAAALDTYHTLVQEKLVGMKPDGSSGDIVGQPIGKEGLLAELEAEVIAYSPDELLAIANEQFAWCEEQMRQAAEELGYKDWKQGLEHVKTKSVPPGDQPQLVKSLAKEATDFMKRHDLVTVPPVAETYATHMMSAEQQKQSPFFLGGSAILIAYPTNDMALATKKMVMRGNNKHFSKATVFHELIPGHRLQLFQADRHRTYRQMFNTPFFIEGWAMYWEFVLWKRRDFFTSPEDRIGTMFWRMHRCARITLSLGFHLGKVQPQEAIDYLVDRVGHERSTAEGEVRRWLGGDYGPLYQIGYMIGALQMLALREEALQKMGEKEFHDAVLQLGAIPVELARAALLGRELERDYEASWRFYKGTKLNDP